MLATYRMWNILCEYYDGAITEDQKWQSTQYHGFQHSAVVYLTLSTLHLLITHSNRHSVTLLLTHHSGDTEIQK